MCFIEQRTVPCLHPSFLYLVCSCTYLDLLLPLVLLLRLVLLFLLVGGSSCCSLFSATLQLSQALPGCNELIMHSGLLAMLILNNGSIAIHKKCKNTQRNVLCLPYASPKCTTWVFSSRVIYCCSPVPAGLIKVATIFCSHKF